MRALLLAGVIACSQVAPPERSDNERPAVAPKPQPPPPPTPEPPDPPEPPPTLVELSPGVVLAIVDVAIGGVECSGLGGNHFVLTLRDGSSRIVHAGGHGSQIDLTGPLGHGYAVAEILMTPAREDHPGSGWCIPFLPRDYAGRARRVILATGELDAGEIFDLVRRTGLPRYVDDTYATLTRVLPRPRDARFAHRTFVE